MKKIVLFTMLALSMCLVSCSSSDDDSNSNFKEWAATQEELEKGTGTYVNDKTYLDFHSGYITMATYDGTWEVDARLKYSISGDSIFFEAASNPDGMHSCYIMFTHGVSGDYDELLIRGDKNTPSWFKHGYYRYTTVNLDD